MESGIALGCTFWHAPGTRGRVHSKLLNHQPDTTMQYYTPSPETRLRQGILDFLAGAGHALNFLFVLPHTLSEAEWKEVLMSAKRLTRYGYVYVADACQREMEDRQGVRFMPFRNGVLPHFGELAAVFVVHDTRIARKAEQFYLNAQVSTINPWPESCRFAGSETPTALL